MRMRGFHASEMMQCSVKGCCCKGIDVCVQNTTVKQLEGRMAKKL
jgi:hypothetical protein